MGFDWADPGQADLAAMGMATEIEVSANLRRLRVDLRRVYEQEFKGVRWHIGKGQGGIGTAEIVWVVDAGKPNTLAVPLQFQRFVEQDAQAHRFERGHHVQAVVVTQHAEDARSRLDAVEQMGHLLVDLIA